MTTSLNNSMPCGELTIQTLAMPMNTNANGDIFGGWLVSQMDLAAGIVAKKIAHGRAATVAINSMSFLSPVHVGDLVSCYVSLTAQGSTSMTFSVEVWREILATGEKHRVTQGSFVFVAIDDKGHSRSVLKRA